MAHLVDREVAGRVILQPAPWSPRSRRVSMSFANLASMEEDGGSRLGASKAADFLPGLLSRTSSSSLRPPPRARSPELCRTPKASEPLSSPYTSPKRGENQRARRKSSLITFDEPLNTFHLRAGHAQYAFCVDGNGSLEHLCYGPWVGTGHDLTYLSENDPSLTFEPAPAGAQYSTNELLRLVAEDKVDSRQLWSMSTQMKDQRGGDWHMARVENLTWRLRKLWSQDTPELEGQPLPADDAEALLKILDRSNIPFEPEPKKKGRAVNAEGHVVGEPEPKRGRQGEKGSKLMEVSEYGTGDFRNPSLELCFQQDGSRLLPLVYQRHRIVDGIVPSISGLPLLGARDPAGAQTLVVDMVDTYTELKVQLIYTVFPGLPAVSRRMVVRNSTRVGMGDIDLLKCMSATFDFLTEDWHLVSLHGGWACERQITVRRLQEGTVDLGSRRGVSSHQMNPFCVLTSGPPSETSGHCYGISLLYSGNWIMEVEQSETGCVRVNAGINPLQFSWDLGVTEAFETPECVCVFSDKGLGGITSTFHQLFGERLIAPRWRNLVCPVLINTWEALYFDVYHERVMELARPAKEVGVELLVLDDGWFGHRDDDSSSLGDWNHDPRKLPRGLAGLAEDLNALGLRLGVWVEPEMVNTVSDLFNRHPEWVLHHPNRLRSEGRNQLVLDLSRREVQDYIIESIGAVLSGANIEYVKWDMNRALTDAYSAKLPPRQQGEVYHRYVLGIYRVFEVLTEQFPHVLFESCASGGGRFDPALLAWCPQAWTSDNTDAFSRTRIQMGTSLWAPVRCMGAHITACPNHQTHRSVLLKTRFTVALFGTFGLELDLTKMTTEEKRRIRELIALRNRLCQVTLHGCFFRLPGFGYPGASPGNSAGIGESNVYAWMFVSPDSTRALVSAIVFHRDTVGKFPSRLKLRGLRPDMVYDVDEHLPTEVEEGVFNGIFQAGGPRYKHRRRLRLAGAVLMDIGLPLHFNFDGDSVLLELTYVTD